MNKLVLLDLAGVRLNIFLHAVCWYFHKSQKFIALQYSRNIPGPKFALPCSMDHKFGLLFFFSRRTTVFNEVLIMWMNKSIQHVCGAKLLLIEVNSRRVSCLYTIVLFHKCSRITLDFPSIVKKRKSIL